MLLSHVTALAGQKECRYWITPRAPRVPMRMNHARPGHGDGPKILLHTDFPGQPQSSSRRYRDPQPPRPATRPLAQSNPGRRPPARFFAMAAIAIVPITFTSVGC